MQAALRRMAEVGIPAVQLDATLSGIRPRELSPRTRKDLAALIQRQGLRLAGLDLFIPRSHYLESDRQDRAITAALAAIELAADLGDELTRKGGGDRGEPPGGPGLICFLR